MPKNAVIETGGKYRAVVIMSRATAFKITEEDAYRFIKRAHYMEEEMDMVGHDGPAVDAQRGIAALNGGKFEEDLAAEGGLAGIGLVADRISRGPEGIGKNL